MAKRAASNDLTGEHIFPASKLTPLAIQWKELTASGRHKEAMFVLEDIVKGSTAMFERLAQYEDFHYTVELPVLVSAAQEKVIKWLMRWQPKKGRLFSWFCCHEKTPVLLEDGRMRPIGELVEEKYTGKVICWDVEHQRFQKAKVINWSKTQCDRKEWRKLIIRRPSGYQHPAYITKDHRIMTQTGWAPVDWLNPRDTLYLNEPTLTLDGEAVLLGCYLGDGSINRKNFVVTHSQKQRFYNDWFNEKFRGGIYEVEEGTKHFNSFTNKFIDSSGQTHVRIAAADLWPDFKRLAHPKQIDAWLLERITPVSLAIWYMDDGNLGLPGNKVTFAAMSFSVEECEAITQAFFTRFGLHIVRHTTGSLYLKASSRDRFFELIAPYVLPGFDYKLTEEFRTVPKIDLTLVTDRLVQVHHREVADPGQPTWQIKRRFKPNLRSGETFEALKWKYDLTVEHYHNFFAGRSKIMVSNSTCAKNAFRSELAKVNQYRKRFHVTSENLERFYGCEDHEVDKHDVAADVRHQLHEMVCSWGDPQEIGAIRYLIECIIDDEHNKHDAIRGAAYAYGISFDLSRFFYGWAVASLRAAMYERVYIPFTEQDLFMASEAYSHIKLIHETMGWDFTKKFIVIMGGLRFKVPTAAQVARTTQNYRLYREIQKSDLDPDSIAEIARKHKKTARSAQEIFEQMSTTLDPKRYGEHPIFDDNPLDSNP